MNLFSDYKKNDNLPFTLPSKDGYCINWNDSLKGYNIKIPNGELFYAEEFFTKKISDRSVEYFLENNTISSNLINWRDFEKEKLESIQFKNILWQHDKIKMYGKEIYVPRYSAWYGDANKSYTYSGITFQAKKWNKGLLYIKQKIEERLNLKFNSVLLNWYRDGDDHMGWHTDDEKELGKNPIIASVNFGEERDFLIKSNKTDEKISIPLKHGTLLIMSGELQHHWKHSIPKRKKRKNARFNLTFRTIK